MSRNEETIVYGIPQLYHERYFHPFSYRHKTSGNVGDIIPIMNWLLVQPGDTVSINLRSFLKLTTSKFASMDNLCCDIFAFAQDWQNDWIHTKEFWGEDQATPFESLPEYTIPQFIISPGTAIEHDDIIHHLVVPQMEANKGVISTETRDTDIEVERLSYNTYIDIYNRYFRDQNYIAPIAFDTGDSDINWANVTQKKLLKAARLHDYFAGAPAPQKGEPERINLLQDEANLEIFGNGMSLGMTNGTKLAGVSVTTSNDNNTDIFSLNAYGANVSSTGNISRAGNGVWGVTTDPEKSGITGTLDTTQLIAQTVNALRMTVATQQIKEELMWFGSRFEEIIFSQWGVSINSATMRIPEFLGGHRFWLNMDTVLQTSSTDSTSPQGNSAGYSTTLDEQFLFTKSFTTWQNIMIVAVVRQDHTYGQGIANQHLKKRRYEFYWDKFAGLGAQPRKVKEICVNGNSSDENIWNFAPAWREYTSMVDRACGLMQPGVQDTLAYNTYTDDYTSIPNAGQSWIEETPTYVDRTLVVPSYTTDQLMMDFVFDIKLTSIIPNYRLPGLDKL